MTIQEIHAIWPFFGLSIQTPQLRLEYPTDQMIPALVALADRGIHPSDSMPFSSSWSLEAPAERAVSIAQFQWRSRASLSPAKWRLPFAVFVDGEIVGVQDAFATDFDSTQVATTGSWLSVAHQSRGIGTEMRRAILYFLFEGLGARIAKTEAFESNAASKRVTEKLGYRPDGETIALRGDGEAERSIQYRLEREWWTADDDIEIRGLPACLPFFDGERS